MPEYAKGTKVTVEKSRAEIERTLRRYGASSFAYAWDEAEDDQAESSAVVYFKYNGKAVRFDLTLPAVEDFRYTPSRKWEREDDHVQEEWEKGCRQRWRALALVIKAKLEAIDSGITTFDTEFLPHIMLPGGQTVADTILPQIDEAYEQGGGVPRLIAEKTPPERMLPDYGVVDAS